MHQNFSAFDDTDPDASQALEDALPIVEEMLAEKAKPEPRDADVRAAWLAQIAEICSRLDGPAARAGCDVAELIELAELHIRRERGSLPRQAAPFTEPVAPDIGFGALSMRISVLEAERSQLIERNRQLDVQKARNGGRMNAIAREVAKIERQMRTRGARLGR